MADNGSHLARTKWVIRECIAATAWTYVLLKAFVFDFDIYVLDRFAPGLRWIIDYKVFLILAVIAIASIALGPSTFFLTALYIAAYPIVVICWKIPKIAFKKWTIVIVSTPILYRFIVTFRSTFFFYTAAILSCLVAVLGTNHALLGTAVLILVGFVVFHLYRSLKKAYGTGAFSRLADMLSKLRASIDKGTFDGIESKAAAAAEQSPSSNNPLLLYLMRQLADLVDKRVRLVAASRKYDFCLILGWLYTVALTCFTFAFAYTALHKFDTSSFRSDNGASFWAFLGFSLSAITPARLSAISPASKLAILVYSLQACSTLVILVILVFTVLTAAREAFRQEVEVFGEELKLTAESLDSRITQVYKMTLAELEAVMLPTNSGALVNVFRQARGLPALALPPAKEIRGPQPTSES